MTEKKIKFALVGCGRISTNHINSIKEHSDRAELIDICDIDPKALEEKSKITQANCHQSIDEMLKNTKADAVILTTPSGLHSTHAIKAAKAGFHVVSEKPMATKLKDAYAMVRACDSAGKRLFVVKQNRKNATLQLVKNAIDSGRFGKIYTVTTNVFWTRPQSYYDQAPWRGTWEYDGGAFMNQASHYLDLLHWLIGPIESVHSFTSTLERNIEAEDTGVINLKWRSGTLGTANVTMLTYPKNFEGSITILGEKGTVRIGGLAVNKIEHWEFADSKPDDEKVKQASYETTSVYGAGHPLYYENVIDVLQNKAKAEVDGREGLKSLELIIAAYRSARDGKVVSFPLEL